MDKKVAAIEFGSKKIKLVIGYELDGQVYVLYAMTKPYGFSVENGTFTDMSKVVETVKEIKSFTDPSVKMRVNLSQALLAIPSYGLQVMSGKQFCNVSNESGLITDLDIRNVYSLIKNSVNKSCSENDEIIDVIPKAYFTESGVFETVPKDVESTSISIEALVYLLPKNIAGAYQNALKSGDMNVKRSVISEFGAANYLSTIKDIPNQYFLVDIGAATTTVSLVKKDKIYASRHFSWGGDNITERIVENFNINAIEADKIKVLYGIDKRQMSFKTAVSKNEDYEGNEVKHYSDELNVIIKKELENLVSGLNSSMNDIAEYYRNKSILDFPMILVGGGSQLNGLVDYLEPKVRSESLRVIRPTSLGARNPTFLNCLGMILANAKYPAVFDEQHPQVGRVTRDPVEE